MIRHRSPVPRLLPAVALVLLAAACGRGEQAAPPAPRTVLLTDDAPFDGAPDVAPDSTFLVFVSDRGGVRKLYRMDLPSGDVRALTGGPAVESDPRISPDGGRVAFVRREPTGGSLWILDAAGGTPAAVAADTSGLATPAWSPDGARLLAVSGARGLVLAEVPATGRSALVPADWPVPEDASDPWWAADGTLVYRSGPPEAGDLYALDTAAASTPRRLTRTDWDERSPCLRDGVLAFIADPGGVPQVQVARWPGEEPLASEALDSGRRTASRPVVWPGGGSVVYGERGGWAIATRPVNGGETTVLVPPEADNRHPVFDAEARNVFYTSDVDGNDEIYVVEVASLTVANLTTNPGRDFEPDFCPPLHRLVFVTERDGDENILTIDESGLDETVLAPSPARDVEPRFSPTGAEVAFVSDRAGSPDIWRVATGLAEPAPGDSTGGEPVRVTGNDHGAEHFPAWVEDGAALVFDADWSGRESLWRIDARNGGPAVPIPADTAAGSWDAHAAADPGGTRIVFTRCLGGDRDLWILELDGGKAVRAVSDPRTQEDHASFSPDGRNLVFQKGGAVNLVRRELTGSRRR